MHKEWRHLHTAAERLVWARQRAGYENATDAANVIGVEPPTYLGHENGSRGLSRAGHRYAQFFRVSFEWLMHGKGAPTSGERSRPQSGTRGDTVPIVGRIGAGPEGSILFSEDEQPLGEAPKPPGWSETTVAAEVEGNSMRPIAYDGWLVYYDNRRGALTPDMIGQPCVLWLESGHAVVKVPFPGSARGLYNLESANPAIDTMRDRRVKSAALVTAFIPRRPASLLHRKVKGSVST